jgi:hypothetical protein
VVIDSVPAEGVKVVPVSHGGGQGFKSPRVHSEQLRTYAENSPRRKRAGAFISSLYTSSTPTQLLLQLQGVPWALALHHRGGWLGGGRRLRARVGHRARHDTPSILSTGGYSPKYVEEVFSEVRIGLR